MAQLTLLEARMIIDSWFPIGFKLPSNEELKLAKFSGQDWQIFDTITKKNILVVKHKLYKIWESSGVVTKELFHFLDFGEHQYAILSSENEEIICPINLMPSPSNIDPVINLAKMITEYRDINQEVSLHDAIYVEGLNQLLPSFSVSSKLSDKHILGSYLTGGVKVPYDSFRRINALVSWITESDIEDLKSYMELNHARIKTNDINIEKKLTEDFSLPGRPALEKFFNEHIVDIIRNEEKYSKLGINFPAAIILHGPPGCGKTYAVEKLVEHIGWLSYQIDSSSIGDSHIHGTSKKISDIFKLAIKKSPSIIIIDEMEAFLADRDMGSTSSHHRIEEVAEFLRRIPEAIKNRVLIIAMTNKINMIDPAILRRGRFDHVIKIDMASEAEIFSLLKKLITEIPTDKNIDLKFISDKLHGRPLSDVAFTIREGARISVKEGYDNMNGECLKKALALTLSRG